MAGITASEVTELRALTGAGVMACRQALVDADGDMVSARSAIEAAGIAQAAKRAGREAREGYVADYNHAGRVVGVVELRCETDFVARNEEFRGLARDIAQQLAAMGPASAEELLAQAWIRDGSVTVSDLVTRASARFGEKVEIGTVSRVSVGG